MGMLEVLKSVTSKPAGAVAAAAVSTSATLFSGGCQTEPRVQIGEFAPPPQEAIDQVALRLKSTLTQLETRAVVPANSSSEITVQEVTGLLFAYLSLRAETSMKSVQDQIAVRGPFGPNRSIIRDGQIVADLGTILELQPNVAVSGRRIDLNSLPKYQLEQDSVSRLRAGVIMLQSLAEISGGMGADGNALVFKKIAEIIRGDLKNAETGALPVNDLQKRLEDDLGVLAASEPLAAHLLVKTTPPARSIMARFSPQTAALLIDGNGNMAAKFETFCRVWGEYVDPSSVETWKKLPLESKLGIFFLIRTIPSQSFTGTESLILDAPSVEALKLMQPFEGASQST